MSVWDVEKPETNVTNSWIGSTGMVFTPTARNCPAQGAVVSYHWINTDPDAGELWSANIGLTPNFEIGAVRLADAFVEGDDAEYIANVKYRVSLARWTDNPDAPELSVGVWDLGNKVNRSFFLVMSQDLTIAEEGERSELRAHLGYGDTKQGDGLLDGFFGGIEFSPMENGLLQIEHDGENLNLAYHYNFSETIALELGSIDGDLGLGLTWHKGF